MLIWILWPNFPYEMYIPIYLCMQEHGNSIFQLEGVNEQSVA